MAVPTCLYQGVPLGMPLQPGNSGTLNSSSTGGTIAAGTVVSIKAAPIIDNVEGAAVQIGQLTIPAGTNTNKVSFSWSTPYPMIVRWNVYAGTVGNEKRILTGATSTQGQEWTGAAGSGDPASSPPAETTSSPGLYTPPNGSTALVTEVLVANGGQYDGYLWLSRVASGGTGSSTNRIVAGRWIGMDAGSPLANVRGTWRDGPTRIKLSQPLRAGDFLTGFVSRPECVVTINGIVYS